MEVGAAYRLFEQRASYGDRSLRVDVLGGGRYWHYEQTIEPLRFPRRRSEVDWVDPFTGSRMRIDLTENIEGLVHADIGGGDIGNCSEVTWNAYAALG